MFTPAMSTGHKVRTSVPPSGPAPRPSAPDPPWWQPQPWRSPGSSSVSESDSTELLSHYVSAVSSITVHADCEGCLSSAAHWPKVPYERTVWLQAASRARSSPISSAGDRGDMLDFLVTCLWPSSATCNHTFNR